MEITRKVELDAKVAALFGMKKAEVASITEAFLHEVLKALVEVGHVRLNGLGELHVRCWGGVQPKKDETGEITASVPTLRCYVAFTKAAGLRKALKEKYRTGQRKEKPHGKVRSRRRRKRKV